MTRIVTCPECGTRHEVPAHRPGAVCVCRLSLPAEDPRSGSLLELPVLDDVAALPNLVSDAEPLLSAHRDTREVLDR